MSEFATALTDTVILDEGAAFETFVQFSFGVFVLWSHNMLDGAKSHRLIPNILYRVYVVIGIPVHG